MAQPATHQPGSSLQATFERLASRWHDETGMLSSPSQITRHPAYQEIIQLG